MFSSRSLSLLSVLSLLALSASAVKTGPSSKTKVWLDEKVGAQKPWPKGSTVAPSVFTGKDAFLETQCDEEGLKYQDPVDFFLYYYKDDGTSVKLNATCHIDCKEVVATESNYRFTVNPDDEKALPLLGKDPKAGKVWCDDTIKRDESLWKAKSDVPFPDSEKHFDPWV